MKHYIKSAVFCIFATTLAACDSNPSKPDASGSPQPMATVNTGAPAPNSIFAKLKLGMSQRQVEDLIGSPGDIKTGFGGKAFIPVYNMIGNDTTYTHAFYKNEGILTFTGGIANIAGNTNGRLSRIIVDPTEDGYNN